MTEDVRRPMRALLSVSDKTGLEAFARRLAAIGIELVSTGGTAAALKAAGLTVLDVAQVTGVPEMLDGRVKTLHPMIHGGILANLDDAAHRDALGAFDITPIGLVVCNLYPFEDALAKGHDAARMVETIDVGGPTMTRAAAKNFGSVAVVVDPSDYDVVADALEAAGTDLALRRRLSAKAFARLAAYDAAIAGWLAAEAGAEGAPGDDAVDIDAFHALGGRRIARMRYGENPHQEAAFYATGSGDGLAGARLLQGKALSYNNVADADAAWFAAAQFAGQTAVVIVKHANPCGIGEAPTLLAAYEKALRCDTVSAFGGVIAVTTPLDGPTAEAIARLFTEVIVAPGADDAALAILSKKTNLRLLLTDGPPAASGRQMRTVSGGFLVQSADDGLALPEMRVVSARAPTEAEQADLAFAWRAVKPVKSNAIVFARDGATVGIGAGQMSRVDAARIAAWKAADAARAAGEDGSRTQGSVAASDAFFPFADGLEIIAEAGATAVIQPGGSKRDEEVIAAADRHGMAMVFTGKRHFRH